MTIGDAAHGLLQALRFHRRHFSTTMSAILVLALGIGASTAVFSVVATLFLRALPYGDATRVVSVWEDASQRGGSRRTNVSAANFLDWRERNRTFQEMAAVRNVTLTLSDGETPYSPLVHAATANYFSLLDAPPLLGRTFRTGEDSGLGARVAILSYGLWQTRFAGAPDVIGRKLPLDGVVHEIIGVMPRAFYSVNFIPTQPELWVPLSFEANRRERDARRYLVFARLRASVTPAQASLDMSNVAAALAREYPAADEKWGATVVPIREQLVGDIQRPVAFIGAGVAALFLIATFNFMNLLLASGSGRRQEIAARLALGASPFRIFRQLLAETTVLTMAGAALGIALAVVATPWVIALVPAAAGVPFLDSVQLDGPTTAFAIASGLIVGVLCTSVTTHRALRAGLSESLRHGARLATGDSTEQRARQALVVLQISVSVILMLGGGLTVRSFWNLLGFPLGFDPRDVTVVTSSLRGARYQDADVRTQFFREATRRLEALPGVTSVTGATRIPPVTAFDSVMFGISGAAGAVPREATAAIVAVAPRYFETLGTTVRRGREIQQTDTSASLPVVVISETLARQHFPREDPIGRVLVVRQRVAVSRQIVGVVGDIRSVSPDPRPQPVLYVPHTQFPIPDLTFVVRTEERRRPSPASIRQTIVALDPTMPVYDLRALDDVVSEGDWLARFVASLLGLFTAVGLALVGIGLYGILAFVVAERRREIGLRVALGAQPLGIAGFVSGSIVRMVALGAAGGLAGFFSFRRLIEPLLFGVGGSDPFILIATLFVLLVTASVACAIPLRTAIAVSPIVALKND